MKPIIKTLISCALCIVAFGAATAQQLFHVKIDLKENRLKNGLRVITVEDHRAPVISLVLTYNVGGANERKGRGEFAHFFEHMMFQGTQNVAPDEISKLIFGTGGVVDATTGDDRTLYYEIVPANQLDLPLFLESDRLRGLVISQENFDRERNVVQEERRMRVINQPYGRSAEVLNDLLYDNFPYKHGGMDSMADLNAASLDDLKEFFATYYAPNNAVMALVGDFKTAEALVKIKKYFENIPRRPDPPALDLTEPEHQAERRATIEDALAQSPQVRIAFKAVPGNTPDFYALQILSSVLQGGQSSRLYQKLVKEKELVNGVGGFMSEKRGPGAFYITTTLRPGKKTEEVEAAIYEEIDRLRKDPVSDLELEKAKNSINLSFLNTIAGTRSSLLRGFVITQFAVYYNDPNLINTQLDKAAAVTRQDVLRVAQKYLRPTNRVVVITMPKAKAESTGAAGGEEKMQ